MRSRGLGDVYKRQLLGGFPLQARDVSVPADISSAAFFIVAATPVSYTHLTLPTRDLV